MNNDRRSRTGVAGFTLIELMIVIAIGTILITIAIPAYNSQIRKSRRTEAKTAILDLAAREERLLATQNNYSADAGTLGYGPAGTAWPVSVGNYYSITVTVGAAPSATQVPTFTATVTPSAGSPQLKDAACTSFIVTQTGAQSATGSNTASCWP